MMEEIEHDLVWFPVVLYDGEREMDVGNITVHQSLNFKKFQIMLKETIGISYNNLTTYLVDNKSCHERRKILITGKVNFSDLIGEKNCYFLVVLKRSRRDRRRNKVNNNNNDKHMTFVYDPFQNYMNWNRVYYYCMPFTSFEKVNLNPVMCEDCMKAEKQGKKAGFHFCVYDHVVAGGFRSNAGPVSRPKL